MCGSSHSDGGHVDVAATAAPRLAKGPAVDTIHLDPVDDVSVTTLIDNTFDMLLTSESGVERAGMRSGLVSSPFFDGGNTQVGLLRLRGRSGLHLGGPAFEPIIPATVRALGELSPELVVPGHCSGWKAQHALGAALPEALVQASSGSSYHLASL